MPYISPQCPKPNCWSMFTDQYHIGTVKSSTTSIDTDYISNTNCLTSHKCGKTITIYKFSRFFHLLKWLIVIEYYRQLYGLPLQCLHRFDRYFIIISWIWWNKPEQLENVMNGWLSIYSDIHDMDNNLKFHSGLNVGSNSYLP